MKLLQILLQEGRKEDLRKKYTEKFKEYLDTLDFILSISDLADTNFKYTDFVLKYTHPNASPEEVEDIVDLVKDFDRFKQSLEVKDINKYDLDGLKLEIELHKETSKSQQKKSFDASGAKKIFEDNNLLIVRPLTYEASCKYGSGTRWCTTTAGNPSYFESHSGGNQALYYIILKNFNRDNKFYKIAVHITPSSEIWWDATDEKMSEREKEVFNLGAPKVIQTIRDDYSKSKNFNYQIFFKNLFNSRRDEKVDVSKSFKSNHKIEVIFKEPTLIPDMPNNAIMMMRILLDGETIDQYEVMITYQISDKIYFDIGYAYDDFDIFDVIETKFNFNLEDEVTQFQLPLNDITTSDNGKIEIIFNNMCSKITNQVVNSMKKNDEFMSSIHGGSSVWNPNRMSYGYTFKQNKGLIKKLVDYLDSDKTGTKLDFLVDIGSLQKKDINGKPYYSHTNQNNWQIPSAFRGQLSSFFNSARIAGILDYNKKGNQFYLKKGPNFDKFKLGQLRAL
jgi:hypothetical protein